MSTALLRTFRVATLAVLLSGCAATTRFTSTMAPGANISPKRIFVASHLVDSRGGVNFGEKFAAGFDLRLAEAFKACGVQVLLKSSTGLELDGGELAKQLDGFKPDTMMVIRMTHGTVNQYGRLLRATYGFDLYEAGPARAAGTKTKDAPLKVVWRSTLDFSAGATAVFPMDVQGGSVADDLAQRMQQDGFFPACTLPQAAKKAASAPAEPAES